MWQPRPLVSRKGILLYLDGLIPSKKNSRITVRRTGRSFPSKKYSEWHKAASTQIIDQMIFRHAPDEQVPFFVADRADVHIHFFFGTLGVADLTNKAESVNDLLVDCLVLPDDNWKIVPRLFLSGSHRKRAPGALIRIVPRG